MHTASLGFFIFPVSPSPLHFSQGGATVLEGKSVDWSAGRSVYRYIVLLFFGLLGASDGVYVTLSTFVQ